MAASVVVRDLRKRYGSAVALDGVSFAIGAGEIFGLLGPNGAGKTTTLECLLGLREPDSGDLEVGGLDARRRVREVKAKIGVALQSTALQDKVTPREALRLFGSFYDHAAAPAELLERFALTAKADAPFDSLSGGQKQRLALALAFVHRPELIVLDEPTTGLDPQARRELHDEILRIKGDGKTVLLTTHDLAEAEQLCDRIAIIDRGRIVATGTPAELVARAQGKQSVSLVTDRPLAAALWAGVTGGAEMSCDGATVSFRTADANASVAAVTALLAEHRVELVELHVRRASLEEIFLGLTRGGATATEDTL
jgi:ABC-2 type transport system ATP-binding protein